LRSELNPALQETGEAGEDAAVGVDEAAEAVNEVEKAAEDAAAAQRDLRSAFLELADPIFAANGALGRLRDAQENLIEVQQNVESTAQDVAEAQFDVAEAALGAQGALEALGDGDLDAGIRLIADALQISDDEARNLLVTLGLLDGKNVTTTVTTRYQTTGTNRNTRGTTGGGVQERAGGGPVAGGTPYLVGERGPELFIPNGSGSIVSNGDTDRLIAALSSIGRSSTHHYNIPIQSTGQAQTDAQLVGAVASVLRRMETM
jgi:hypothetical protein